MAFQSVDVSVFPLTPQSIIAASELVQIKSQDDVSLEMRTDLEVFADIVVLEAVVEDEDTLPDTLPEVFADPMEVDPTTTVEVTYSSLADYTSPANTPRANPSAFEIVQSGDVDATNLPSRDQFGAGDPAATDDAVTFYIE